MNHHTSTHIFSVLVNAILHPPPHRTAAPPHSTHLLTPVHEVHVTINVVVVVGALRLVDWQHLVVDTNAVALCVGVAEHTGLKHLVIAEGNACDTDNTGQ